MDSPTPPRPLAASSILLTVLCAAYLFGISSYAIDSSGFAPIFRYLLSVHDAATVWACLGVALVATLWRWPTPGNALASLLGAHPVWVATLGTVLLALGADRVYQHVALSMDEYAALFQAQIFAAGHLRGHWPPALTGWLLAPAFNGSFLLASPATGEVISLYWPGFSLLLAPFAAIGLPWLCSPALAGLSLWLIHHITLRLSGDRQTAGWAMLLTLACSAFDVNAMTYYAMQAHLCCNLLFVALLLEPSRGRALCAGFVGSLALVLHNPYPHVLFAAPWLVAYLRQRDTQKFVLPLLGGYLPLSLLLGAGWILLRAKIAATMPASVLHGTQSFSPFVLPTTEVLQARVAALAKMWVWSWPGLFVYAIAGWARLRARPAVALMLQSAMLTLVGYLVIPFDQGHGWGYRYFHSALGIVPILAACALTPACDPSGRRRCYAGAAAILSLLVLIPMQLTQVNGFITRHLSWRPQRSALGRDLDFLVPISDPYTADLVQNDPFLRGPEQLMLSRGLEADTRLVRELAPGAVLLRHADWGEQWVILPEPPGAARAP